MLNSIWTRLKQTPRVNKSDIALLFALFALWGGAFSARPYAMRLDCLIPDHCTSESLLWIDRTTSDGTRNSLADRWSDVTQNGSGILAVAVPFALHGGLAVIGRVHPVTALAGFGADFLILLQGTVINGLTNEIVRLTVQRPRPFVYRNVNREGKNPAHYTSFYSGHTSFAAVATLTLFLILLGRGAPRWILALSLAAWIGLTASTGILRVMAGVHFLTDVLVGAIVGSIIALAVALLHRDRKNPVQDA